MPPPVKFRQQPGLALAHMVKPTTAHHGLFNQPAMDTAMWTLGAARRAAERRKIVPLETPTTGKPNVQLQLPKITQRASRPSGKKISSFANKCNAKTEAVMRAISCPPELRSEDSAIKSPTDHTLATEAKAMKLQLARIMDVVDSATVIPEKEPEPEPEPVKPTKRVRVSNPLLSQNTLPLRNAESNAKENIQWRLQQLRQWPDELSKLKGTVTQTIKERAKLGRGDFVLENLKCKAPDPDDVAERFKRRDEQLKRVREFVREAEEEVKQRAEHARQELEQKTLRGELAKQATFIAMEARKRDRFSLVWLPLVRAAARISRMGKVLTVTLQELETRERREVAAVVLQTFFRRKWLNEWKRKRIKRGFQGISRLLGRYSAWWAIERQHRAGALLTTFLTDSCKSSKIQNAIKTFFMHVKHIQDGWRKYHAWKSVVLEGRAELWDEIEKEVQDTWIHNKDRLRAMYRDSKKSREEVMRETGGFDMYNPPLAISTAIRDIRIEQDMKTAQRQLVLDNREYQAALDVYLLELRKNKSIDDARRCVTGSLSEEDSIVAKMRAPVKPRIILVPSRKHMTNLIETCRQELKAKDRADFVAKRQAAAETRERGGQWRC